MNYEEIARALGDVDDALLEEWEKARPTPWRRWGALAACLCLTAGLVWLGLRAAPGEPAPMESPSLEPDGAATAQTFVRAPSSPPSESAEPTLVFAEGEAELGADIAPPDGYFIRDLSPEAIAGIWGQSESLAWEGVRAPELTGNVIYNGDGTVWVVNLRGESDGGELTLQLSPGQIPPACIVYEGGATCEFYGTPVTAVRWNGGCEVTFLKEREGGDIGVRIWAEHTTEQTEELLSNAVSQSLRAELRLDGLAAEDVPEWRSEDLTEEAAQTDPLGAYLPKTLPADYAFETAHRELGEGRDWLSACWTAGYDALSVSVYAPCEGQEQTYGLVHADEREKYDLTYYGVSRTGERENVPEEDWYRWQSPCFYAEELTMDVIERRLSAVDMGNVHTNFGVLYPDGTVVRVSVTAERERIPALLGFLMS